MGVAKRHASERDSTSNGMPVNVTQPQTQAGSDSEPCSDPPGSDHSRVLGKPEQRSRDYPPMIDALCKQRSRDYPIDHLKIRHPGQVRISRDIPV